MNFGNIVITGGGGFIGRAILSEQSARWPLAKFTVYGRDPMKLQHVHERYGVATVLGDVLIRDRMAALFAGRSHVIHAAAMKHIPQGEMGPDECFRVNVVGSSRVMAAAVAAGVEHLILISTDKACEPVNAYGASKFMMERLAHQWAQKQSRTQIHLVRYGNVVGSTGSVIPLFQKQAAHGQKLTVTDPEMTRFWLSPLQAVEVIAQSISEPSGTILVPKLRMMRMTALAAAAAPGADIVVTGVRPGEKSHECLMTALEAQRAINLDDRYFRVYSPGAPYSLANGGRAYTSDQAPPIASGDMQAWIREGEAL